MYHQWNASLVTEGEAASHGIRRWLIVRKKPLCGSALSHHEERRAITARRDTSYREEAPIKPVQTQQFGLILR
jgi:hypothetical protein